MCALISRFATTPFLALLFFGSGRFFDCFRVRFFVFDFDLVVAAFFAITDLAGFLLQILLILVLFSLPASAPFPCLQPISNSLNVGVRPLSYPNNEKVIPAARRLPTLVCAWCKH